MTETKKQEIGRLALRQEGEWWNAYWSPSQTSMADALLVGSIRIKSVRGRMREDFIALMQAAFDTVVEDVTGETPTWTKPRPAPESERGGHA